MSEVPGERPREKDREREREAERQQDRAAHSRSGLEDLVRTLGLVGELC